MKEESLLLGKEFKERIFTMNKTKLLCLFLACLFFIVPLASCDGDGDGGGVDGGGISDDGSVTWEEVDFKGATLKHAISVLSASGATYPATEKYIRGADASTTDEVIKKSIQRNNKVETDLNLKVEYMELEVGGYSQVMEDIGNRVLGSSTDAPDIYTNDMRGFTFACVAGYLTNVNNPLDASGNLMTSYFDFKNDSWNYSFMSDLTLDRNKVYTLAGDYHIDLVRAAYVLFVNKNMFNQNAKVLGCEDINDFYGYVLDGIWDYQMLTTMCAKVWQDNGSSKNRPDRDDGRLGLAINERFYFNFVPASGLSTYYLDDEGKPKLIDGIDEMNRLGSALRTIQEHGGSTDGIYSESGMNCVEFFMQNSTLFATGVLGELESEEFRAAEFDKGLTPIPKYDQRRQEDYHTMIEQFAELSAILINAPSFTLASAYLQYATENSKAVLTEYYEFSLKFKYNDDPTIRSMIDLVYDCIDSPFGMWFETVIMEYVEGDTSDNLHYALSRNALSGWYDKFKGPYERGLDKALSEFAKVN